MLKTPRKREIILRTIVFVKELGIREYVYEGWYRNETIEED